MNIHQKEIYKQLFCIFEECAQDVYMEFIKDSNIIIYRLSIDMSQSIYDSLQHHIYEYNRLLCVPYMELYFKECLLNDEIHNSHELKCMANKLICLHNELMN